MTAPKDILTHTVDITVDDGTTMGGYVARPTDPGPHPGVVVAMELFGLSAHVRDVCDRLATGGFVAVAPICITAPHPGWSWPKMLPGANAASNCCTSRPANRSCVTSPRPSPGYTRTAAQPSAWSVSASAATSPTWPPPSSTCPPSPSSTARGCPPPTSRSVAPSRPWPAHRRSPVACSSWWRRRPGHPTRTPPRHRAGAAHGRGAPRDHHLPRRGPWVPQRPASHLQPRSGPRRLAARAGPAHR